MTPEKAIKVLMAEAGLTKSSLADKAGVSRPTVDGLMEGRGNIDSARKVAEALGCAVGDLCLDGGDDD